MGDPVGAFGRPGQGPGEFFRVLDIAVPHPGLAIVADEAFRLQLFEETDQGWRHGKSVRVPGVPWSVCATRDTAFVSIHSDDRAGSVMKVDLGDSTEAENLISLYASANPIVRQMMSEAIIECVPEQRSIVLLPRRLGQVVAMSHLGEILWVTHVADYRPPMVREEPDGRVAAGMPLSADSMDFGASLNLVEGVGLLVQLAVYGKEQGIRIPVGFDTYVLNARTGSGRYVGRLPFRVLGSEGGTLLVGRDHPYPRVWLAGVDTETNAH